MLQIKGIKRFLFLSLLMAVVLYMPGCVTTGSVSDTSTTKTGTIVAIESLTEMEDKVVILISANSEINYTPYRLDSPLRLVVDIPDAVFANPTEELPVNDGTITTIRKMDISPDGDSVARMEIYLAGDAGYFISKPQDNQIQIEIQKVTDTFTESSVSFEETTVTTEETVWEEPATKIINVVTEEDPTTTKISIIGDGRMDNFEYFTLDDPARLVLDVNGLSSNFPNKEIDVGTEDIDSIRVGIHPDKVRFVFESPDTGLLGDYKVYSKENKVMVVFGDMSAFSFETDTSPLTPATSPGETVTITGINFEDTPDVARIIISSTTEASYTASMVSDTQVIIDITNAVLDDSVEKEFNFSTSDGPLSTVNIYRTEDSGTPSIRVIVELKSSVAYNNYASGSDIVVDFARTEGIDLGSEIATPVPVDVGPEEGLAQPAPTLPTDTTTTEESEVVSPGEIESTETSVEKKYTGKEVTFVVSGANVVDILNAIAEVSDMNILIQPAVTGTISLRLVKVPWDQALDIILRQTGLGMELDGNVIIIDTQSNIYTRRTETLTYIQGLEELVAMETRRIDISYANLTEIITVTTPMLTNTRDRNGSITSYPQTNTLLITDVPSRLDSIVDMIRSLDVPPPEIRIEARIVDMNDNFVNELGINWVGGWTGAGPDGTDSYKGTFGMMDTGLINTAALFDTATTIFPALPTIASLGGVGGATAMIGLLNDSLRLDVQLHALENLGEAEIIESPKLRVLNNVAAVLNITTEIPTYNPSETTDESGNVTVTTTVIFEPFETILNITPTVTPDNRIRLIIDLTHNTRGVPITINVDGVDNIYYERNEKNLVTEVLVDNRDTIVIGGLYRKDSSDTERGFPGLRDVPLLGWLFKVKTVRDSRRELLIFITPTIVRETTEIYSGR